jgi:hypothetical protein
VSEVSEKGKYQLFLWVKWWQRQYQLCGNDNSFSYGGSNDVMMQ